MTDEKEHVIQGEPDYSYLIGKVPLDRPPISLERCMCGLLLMSGPCEHCEEVRLILAKLDPEQVARTMQAMPRRPPRTPTQGTTAAVDIPQEAPSDRRQDKRALLVVSLIALFGLSWVSWSIDRPRPMDQAERIGELS